MQEEAIGQELRRIGDDFNRLLVLRVSDAAKRPLMCRMLNNALSFTFGIHLLRGNLILVSLLENYGKMSNNDGPTVNPNLNPGRAKLVSVLSM